MILYLNTHDSFDNYFFLFYPIYFAPPICYIHKKEEKREKKEVSPTIFQKKKEHKNETREATSIKKIPIEIEDSPTPRDKMPSPKSPITYVRRPSTRSTSLKGKAILQDPQQKIQEE